MGNGVYNRAYTIPVEPPKAGLFEISSSNPQKPFQLYHGDCLGFTESIFATSAPAPALTPGDDEDTGRRKLAEVAECNYPTGSTCQNKCECRRDGGKWDDTEEKCKKCAGGGDGRLLEGEDECEDEDEDENDDNDENEDEDDNDDENDDENEDKDADDEPGADDVCNPA